MISIQADEQSECKREIENLTEEQATLFLKLVKLYKEDPTVAETQMNGPEEEGKRVREPKSMTPSTVTSETSSQDNGYMMSQAVEPQNVSAYSENSLS